MHLKFFDGGLRARCLLVSPRPGRIRDVQMNERMSIMMSAIVLLYTCVGWRANTFIIVTPNWGLAFRVILLETTGIGVFGLGLLLELGTKYLKRPLQILSENTTNWLLKSEASYYKCRIEPPTLVQLILFQRESLHVCSVVETGLTTVPNFTSYLHSEGKVLITNKKSVTKWIDHIKRQISAYLENSTS